MTSDSSSISKKVFIDVMSDALSLKLDKSGGTMSGNLITGGYFINNIHDPMLPNDAVTLQSCVPASGNRSVVSPMGLVNGRDPTLVSRHTETG